VFHDFIVLKFADLLFFDKGISYHTLSIIYDDGPLDFTDELLKWYEKDLLGKEIE